MANEFNAIKPVENLQNITSTKRVEQRQQQKKKQNHQGSQQPRKKEHQTEQVEENIDLNVTDDPEDRHIIDYKA